MDKLTAAKVFTVVAKTGSFTITADRLELSRSMVTRYVESLEEWLGARLLNRTTRSVTLTTLGERYLPDVEQWVSQAEKLEYMFRPAESLKGSVRVATSVSFGSSQLAPALMDFMVTNPDVSIDVVLDDLKAPLVEQQIDLAIRIVSIPDESLIGKPIAICSSVLVATKGYLDQHSAIKTPLSLQQHDCIGYRNFERYIWQLRKGEEQVSVEVPCRLTANEANFLLNACLHGAGIAMLPTYIANKHIMNGELVKVLPDWTPAEMDVFAFYASRKHLPAVVRALIDHLAEFFSERRW